MKNQYFITIAILALTIPYTISKEPSVYLGWHEVEELGAEKHGDIFFWPEKDSQVFLSKFTKELLKGGVDKAHGKVEAVFMEYPQEGICIFTGKSKLTISALVFTDDGGEGHRLTDVTLDLKTGKRSIHSQRVKESVLLSIQKKLIVDLSTSTDSHHNPKFVEYCALLNGKVYTWNQKSGIKFEKPSNSIKEVFAILSTIPMVAK